MKTSQSLARGKESRKSETRPVYPFTAIVGQDEMKLALVLNIVNPSIGGVLIMGHRGTGKSTAVRGLADLLPQIWIVRGCSYQCDLADRQNLCDECSGKLAAGENLHRERARIPVVDLPLGATEDRICGTIDIEHALKEGVRAFEPGLLARANRGFLYIDEVNLLEDHLVDLLLDVAATGRNKVERESISVEHPARLVLIGSGNPEEGGLRPQLLDRFGLHVEVETENDLDGRVEIVERCEAFERDPEMFCASLAQEQQQLRNRVMRAQSRAGAVTIDRSLLRKLAQLCSALKIDGHRGELTIARAARSLAAFEGRKKVSEEDVRRVAVMALRHRLRSDPMEETGSGERIQQALAKLLPPSQTRAGKGSGDNGKDDNGAELSNQATEEPSATRSARASRLSARPNGSRSGDSSTELSSPAASDTDLPKLRFKDHSPGKPGQSRARGQQNPSQRGVKRTWPNYVRGRYAGAVNFKKPGARVAVDATLRALSGVRCQVSSVGQRYSLTHPTRHLTSLPFPERDNRNLIPGEALRFKRLSSKSGRLFIFAIDASGSMALNRIGHAKGVMHALLRESYIKRDRVAIVGFRGTSAELLLPPSRSILRARRVLDSLSVGGGTPLSAGLMCAIDLAQRAAAQGSGDIALLLFTDGHANVAVRTRRMEDLAARRRLIEDEVKRLGSEMRKAGMDPVVVDTQNAFTPNGDALALAENLGARYVHMKPSGIAGT